MHGDHVAGLPFIAECLLYRDSATVKVYGPKGLKRLAFNLYRTLFGKADLAKVLTFLPDVIHLPFTCIKARGNHSIPDTIYRIELDGTTIVYTGDTTPVDLSNFAKDVDYLIHEAAETSVTLAKRFKHSTPSQAATVAKRAGARNLVLIHSPELTSEEKRKVSRIFPRTIFPTDHQIIDVI